MSDDNNMHPNWRALATVNFPRQNFVKSSSYWTETSEQQEARHHATQLQGHEAKSFYESVVTTNSSSSHSKTTESAKLKNKGKKKDKSGGKSPELSIFCAAQNDDLTSVKMIYESDKSALCQRDSYGWTPLMVASCAGSTSVVEYLLAKKANDINITDKAGNHALGLAKKNGHLHIVQLLKNSKKRKEKKEKRQKSSKRSTRLYNCEICQMNKVATEDEIKTHLTSTVHLLNRENQEANEGNRKVHYVIPEANRGFQMMLQAGWQSNKGLGPHGKTGKLYPVRTSLKRDRHGLGLEEKKAKKVTHFQAFDTDSVKNKRAERDATLSKRQLKKKLNKEQKKEVDFRRDFYT